MYDAGADIVYQAAGGSGSGVFEAADGRRGQLAIGVDSDQYNTADPARASDVILTSMLKRVDVAVYDFVKSVERRTTFKAGARSSTTSRPTASATPPPVARSTTSRPSSRTTRRRSSPARSRSRQAVRSGPASCTGPGRTR